MISRLSTTRLSVRSLTRSPGLSAIAVVAFALGIGLTTATFSILDGVVLKGLPLEKANELVHMEVVTFPQGSTALPLPFTTSRTGVPRSDRSLISPRFMRAP